MWRDPIGACYEAEEFRSVSDLLSAGNTPFNKLVTVFGYLGCEITYTCDRVRGPDPGYSTVGGRSWDSTFTEGDAFARF